MKYLLDADSAIDYLTGQPGIHALFPKLLKGDVTISGTTFVELYSGASVRAIRGGRSGIFSVSCARWTSPDSTGSIRAWI